MLKIHPDAHETIKNNIETSKALVSQWYQPAKK